MVAPIFEDKRLRIMKFPYGDDSGFAKFTLLDDGRLKIDNVSALDPDEVISLRDWLIAQTSVSSDAK